MEALSFFRLPSNKEEASGVFPRAHRELCPDNTRGKERDRSRVQDAVGVCECTRQCSKCGACASACSSGDTRSKASVSPTDPREEEREESEPRDNLQRPSLAVAAKERQRERERGQRERDARCAPLSSPDPRGASSIFEVSPGQASAYSPRGRRTSGEWNSGERARHTDARARVDRARRSTYVGACCFCVYVCASEYTRTSRARAHHPNRRIACTRRVCQISLALWAINSISLQQNYSRNISRTHPIQFPYSAARYCEYRLPPRGHEATKQISAEGLHVQVLALETLLRRSSAIPPRGKLTLQTFTPLQYG